MGIVLSSSLARVDWRRGWCPPSSCSCSSPPPPSWCPPPRSSSAAAMPAWTGLCKGRLWEGWVDSFLETPLEAAEEEVLEDEGGLEEEGLSLDKVASLSTLEDLFIFLQ